MFFNPIYFETIFQFFSKLLYFFQNYSNILKKYSNVFHYYIWHHFGKSPHSILQSLLHNPYGKGVPNSLWILRSCYAKLILIMLPSKIFFSSLPIGNNGTLLSPSADVQWKLLSQGAVVQWRGQQWPLNDCTEGQQFPLNVSTPW